MINFKQTKIRYLHLLYPPHPLGKKRCRGVYLILISLVDIYLYMHAHVYFYNKAIIHGMLILTRIPRKSRIWISDYHITV